MSKRLRKLLGRADFIYVADCKLASENNLNKITACGEQFVTVMPRTWQENTQFRDKVRQGEITWAHFFSKSNNRKPRSRRDHYYLASGEYTTSNGYRLLWVRSSQKAQQNKDAREQNIKRVFEAIRNVQSRLNTSRLKTRKNIKSKMISILEQNNCTDFIDYKVHQQTLYKTQYKKIGRPKANASKNVIREKCFSISFEINGINIHQESLTNGVFPLLTNLEHHTAKKNSRDL